MHLLSCCDGCVRSWRGRCQAQCPELVAAITVITVGHVAECVCSSVWLFSPFFTCWLLCLLWVPLSLDSELRMVLFAAVVFFQLILTSNSWSRFPKVIFLSSSGSSPWKREKVPLIDPASPPAPVMDGLCGEEWSSPDGWAFTGLEKPQAQGWLLRQQGFGVQVISFSKAMSRQAGND